MLSPTQGLAPLSQRVIRLIERVLLQYDWESIYQLFRRQVGHGELSHLYVTEILIALPSR